MENFVITRNSQKQINVFFFFFFIWKNCFTETELEVLFGDIIHVIDFFFVAIGQCVITMKTSNNTCLNYEIAYGL